MIGNNWKLTLAYDGTAFHGWQVQPRERSIQGTLSDAIATVAGERVLPQGAGRTDAGVHAAGQVASFSLAASIPPENFLHALNRVLPSSVRVLAAETVPAEFHARHSAIGKIYRYRIFWGPICPPFLAPYVTCSRWPLDLAAMQLAAQEILGEHDFTSFAASDPDRAARRKNESPAAGFDDGALAVRRVHRSEWSSTPLRFDPVNPFDPIAGLADEPADNASYAGQILTYTIGGNGFLHHMVRNLVGTFQEIGRSRIAPSMLGEILDGRDRALAGPTAPASGLCLLKVLF